MVEIEVKRGYEVLPDNRVKFGIRVINNGDSAISDVEVILDYSQSLFELEGNKIEGLGTIPPSIPRTAKFILRPLSCVHKEEIGATIRYKDHRWEKHTIDMRSKEVHCVCPFLKEKIITRSDFLKLFNEGYSEERGLNFENIQLEKITDFITHTCKNRLYKVDDFPLENGKILYLAGDSIGEKAHYLLTAVIIEREGIVQVLFKAKSNKEFGIKGFLNEVVENLRHLVQISSDAKEIGVIKREQVINIIDSVVQHTNFSGEAKSSVNIQDSVVQRTNFGSSEQENGKKETEERLFRQQQENERLRKEKEEHDRLRRQEEVYRQKEEERKKREEEERQRKQKESEARLKQEMEELQRKKEEEEKRKREKEVLERKQREEQERKRREGEEKAWKEKEEQEKLRKHREEAEIKVPLKKDGSSSGKRVLVFSLIFGILIISVAATLLNSNNHSENTTEDNTVAAEVDNNAQTESSENSDTYTNSIGMEFVKIPEGEFMMGSPSDENGRWSDEGPVHGITINESFYLGKFEVTQEQWREVMGNNPSCFSYFEGDNLPVEQITWEDAQEFIQRLNEMEGTDKYRLPSEAEWEYACRAGTTTIYYFGDDESKLEDYAWYSENSNSTTHPVGEKKPNPWGLYDMYGNVWEWCQDGWDFSGSYEGAPSDGSAWENGYDSSYNVVRGGGWSYNANNCRSASRNSDGPGSNDYDPGIRNSNIGLRVVREI